jgi:uncharacterized protein
MDRGPIRTCVGCRKRRPQNDLIRLARLADGSVVVDAAHRAGGRGAYVCWNVVCAEEAWDSGRLRKALRCERPTDHSLRRELLRMIGKKREARGAGEAVRRAPEAADFPRIEERGA